MLLQISGHLLIEVSSFLHRKEFAILFEFILIQRFLMRTLKDIDIRADLSICLGPMSHIVVRMSMGATKTRSGSTAISVVLSLFFS